MSRDHDHRDQDMRRLGWVLAMVLAYAGVEVAGGLAANSLALVADAGHMLSDAAALGLSLFALWIARRPAPPRSTYGYHRGEILAALVNAVALVALAVFILVEAVERFRRPPEVAGPLMTAVAVGGLVVNLGGLALLHGGRSRSLNLRGAWLHVVGDTLGSLQAIGAGALVWAFGWGWADPLASVLIAGLIAHSSWSLLKESVAVLMEAAPGHIDVDEVQGAIAATPGVRGVHDLHVWTITSGLVCLSAHVVVDPAHRAGLLARLRAGLDRRFGIGHVTIQLEHEGGDECDPPTP